MIRGGEFEERRIASIALLNVNSTEILVGIGRDWRDIMSDGLLSLNFAKT